MNSQITVAFSGYNIKNTILLAVESFLKMYPSMKSQIIYFDDYSTDSSVISLKARGIKVITWDKSLLQQYNEYVINNPQWTDVQTLSVRVSFIIENISKQTTTDFLLLNDGDVMFKNNNFLEHYVELSKEADIIYQKDHLENFVGLQDNLFEAIKLKCPQIIFAETKKKYITWRMFHSHIFMNLKKLKKAGITSDLLNNETLQMLEGNIYDTFSNFSFRASTSHDIKIKEEKIINQNIIYFGSISCEQRGFVLGTSTEKIDNNGLVAVSSHIHRINQGIPIQNDFVIIDFNKDINELKECEFKNIEHILFNGYTLENIYENAKKRMFKIVFKKIN